MAKASGKTTSTKRTARQTTRKTSSQPAESTGKAAKTTARKSTTRKATTRKATTRKATTRKAEGTLAESKAPAPKIELIQLEGQDGQTKRKQKQNRRRSSKAADTTTSQTAAEASAADEAIAESTAAPTKPAGLRSKTMAHASRGRKRKAAGKEKAPVQTTPSRRKALKRYSNTLPKWPASTEMLSLKFRLRPLEDAEIYPQYSVGLHAWFLKQVREDDAALSRRLHDNPDEKAFTLSPLDGPVVHVGDKIRLAAAQTYELTLTVFSKPVVKWLGQWFKRMPEVVDLKFAPLRIEAVELGLLPMSYGAIAKRVAPKHPKLALSFVSPTSFRRKGNHLPLPMPSNLFGSYLRRWNCFAKKTIADEAAFLAWVDESVLIARHVLHSEYQIVRSQDFSAREARDEDGPGGVTGFVGAVVLQLAAGAWKQPEFVDWWWRLGEFAPYCGTGHKTTYGLGRTVLGWVLPESETVFVSKASLIAQRRAELLEIFLVQRKQRGVRARKGAETWATILARREQGESLMDIARDLGLSHETTNKYAKLARRALREMDGD